MSSRSALVRCYYRYRLFMGFCCVCCEVLYLALYLLHWPAFRAWRLLPVPLPAALAAWLQGAFGDCLLRGACPVHWAEKPRQLLNWLTATCLPLHCFGCVNRVYLTSLLCAIGPVIGLSKHK